MTYLRALVKTQYKFEGEGLSPECDSGTCKPRQKGIYIGDRSQEDFCRTCYRGSTLVNKKYCDTDKLDRAFLSGKGGEPKNKEEFTYMNNLWKLAELIKPSFSISSNQLKLAYVCDDGTITWSIPNYCRLESKDGYTYAIRNHDYYTIVMLMSHYLRVL